MGSPDVGHDDERPAVWSIAVTKAKQLHPLCTFFPRIEGAEFEALVADIGRNGLREAIVLHDGMVLDGGNRYRACLEAGVEPHFAQYDGDGDIVSFVLSANLHRRHLSAGQQAAIVALATDWGQAQRVGNPQFGNVAGLQSVADRAAQSGASDRTQRMADKVAREAPGLATEVAHGTVSLPKAVEKVTGKPRKPAAAPVATEQAAAVPEAAKAPGRPAKVDRVTELEQLVADQAERIEDLIEEVRSLQAQLDGKADERLVALAAELKAVKVSRDIAQRECNAMKREVKSLQRRLGIAQ